MLRGKKILVGITGSIAAYKSAHLVRLLVKAGAEVRVVMTDAATEFITPLTLSTLSKHPVLTSFTNDESGMRVWNNHVDLGLWADLFIIAPASSNTMGKMATGQCDNLLTATYASAKCPVFFAPAMDLDMHAHPANRKNMDTLVSFGNILIPSGTGELASGLEGEGRMAEPEEIVDFVNQILLAQAPLNGKKVVINGGPTYEAIDAVRFIGNHSSGKMALALAEEALKLGASVNLILGPTHLSLSHPNLTLVRVTSADEMYKATTAITADADYVILSAAVSDYKPAVQIEEKQKKGDSNWSIDLVPTRDILADVGKNKTQGQVLVGFALETNNEEAYALGKLEKKNLDMVVLNSLRNEGAGFGHDTNVVTLFTRDKKSVKLPLLSKREVARAIFDQARSLS